MTIGDRSAQKGNITKNHSTASATEGVPKEKLMLVKTAARASILPTMSAGSSAVIKRRKLANGFALRER